MPISLSIAWERWAKDINLIMLVFSNTTYFTIVRVYMKFEDAGSNSRWEIHDGFFWERKKNGQIKGMISRTMLILKQYYKSNPIFVKTFKILGLIVPEKSLIQISLCLTFEWQTEKGNKNSTEVDVAPALGNITGALNLGRWHPVIVHAWRVCQGQLLCKVWHSQLALLLRSTL